MSGLDRRTFLKAAGTGTVGLTATAGCLGGGGGGGGTDTIHVGMVYALGGLGDKSFNDMAHRGIQKAAEEYDNVEFKNAEPSGPSDFKTLQRKYAQSTDPDYDLVVCIGFAQTSALKETSKQFPDQKFMLVDSVVQRDNVASYLFKEHQGSFQVGHLAGLLTGMDFSAGAGSTNPAQKVGFVGGKEIPLIKKFQAGYMAGAKHANQNTAIASAYAGSWSDPAKGKEIAISEYDEGADIVYHAAGGTGIGVFKAAQEEGRFAIGVDADQSKSAPEYKDVILASMVKHVDTAVYTAVGNLIEGNFQGGSINRLGLAENGVEAVLGQQLGSEIPSEVTSALESSRQAIINGDISVPQKPKNV
ncbi:MAG: BMP family protein [Halodesulfurarchaeum sp.]